jgi:3D (Asp-Asp-Asp) domain-containing protein
MLAGVVIMMAMSIAAAWLIADGMDKEAGYNQQMYADSINYLRTEREIELYKRIEKGLSTPCAVTQSSRDAFVIASNTKSIVPQIESLGTYKITFYCKGDAGVGDISASGTLIADGQCAAPPEIPFGTNLAIGGRIYTVTDRGADITGKRIDIYVEGSRAECLERGVEYAEVIKEKKWQ